MGGFDQIVMNCRSSGTSDGSTALTLSRPSLAALALTRSRARSLTSTAHTVAWGDNRARAIEIGPQPQPTSSRLPPGGGAGVLTSKTWVPASTLSGLKTPPAVVASKD